MLKLTRFRLVVVFALVAAAVVLAAVRLNVTKANPKPAVLAPSVSSSLTSALVNTGCPGASATDLTCNGLVNPGDTIRFTLTLNNTSGPGVGNDALNASITDTLNPNLTLVAGSLRVGPVAGDDPFDVYGNVGISAANGAANLLANDLSPMTGNNTNLAVTPGTFSSTQCPSCLNVVLNANGTFTYDPPVGFTGTDTFTYTVTDSTNGLTATGTATMTISGMIWFINNTAAVCTVLGNQCGKLSKPFSTIDAFRNANTGGAGQPSANQDIFIYESGAAYTLGGALPMLAGQRYIGQDASPTNTPLNGVLGITLPPGSTALPVTNTAGNATTVTAFGFTVGSNDTLKGLTITNTGSTAKLTGSGIGTFTVADVTISGTGRAMSLGTGTLNGNFTSVASTSSPGNLDGMNLASLAGTVNFGPVTISGSTLQGILISSCSFASATFGATSVTSSPGDGIAISNTTGGLTFGGTTVTTPTGIGINITGSGATIGFAGTSVTKPATAGTGVSLTTNSGPITFQNLLITTSNGTGLLGTNNTGAVTVTANQQAINATGGPAVNISAATTSPVSLNLGGASSTNSTTNGISLTNVTGIVSLGGGAISGATGVPFAISGGTASVTYSGGITQTNNAAMVTVNNGHNTGTVAFNTGTLSATNGTGLQFDNADGTYSFSGTTTLNGGDAGIDILNGSDGTFTFAANTSITNPTGKTVYVENGNGNVTYSGSITKSILGSSTPGIEVFSKAAGTVTFNTGNISLTAPNLVGIQLTLSACTVNFNSPTITLNSGTNNAILENNNAGTFNFGGAVGITTTSGNGFNAVFGGTANFTGGLVINTTSGGAFNATSSGTVNVCDESPCAPAATGALVNTLTTTTGTALNVSGTTIGANNLEFRSISSNGGSSTGIILDTTGSAGGLHVKGTGAAPSGGTIANKTGSDGATTTGNGIYLNSTSDVRLAGMQLNDFQNSAIRGFTVNGFKFEDSVISGVVGNNSAVIEGAIAFGDVAAAAGTGLIGSSLIDQVNISGSIEHNLEFYGQTGTMNLTISNSNIHDNSVGSGSDGIQMEFAGSAQAFVNITGNTVTNNRSQAIQIAANGSSNVNATIRANTIPRGTQGNEGIVLSNGANGDLTTLIGGPNPGDGNTISGFGGVGIFVGQTPGNATNQSFLQASIIGNSVTSPTTATNHSIDVLTSSTVGQISQARFLIHNNTVTQNSTVGTARGILVDTPDTSTSPEVHATVTKNSVAIGDNVNGVGGLVVQSRQSGIGHFRVGKETAGDTDGNTVTYPNGNPGVNGMRVRQVAPATAELEPGTSGGTSAAALAANNPASTTEVLGTVALAANNNVVLLPALPSLPILPSMASVENGELRIESGELGEMALVESGQWIVESGQFGGAAYADVETPTELGEVAKTETDPVLPLGDAALATVVMTPSVTDNGPSTFEMIAEVAKRAASEVSPTVYSAANVPMMSGETVTVNGTGSGFTLPAGKSVTVTFDAQVAAVGTISPTVTSISSQGTASGTGFGPILTDGDPAPGIQPTLTTIVEPETITGVFNPTSVTLDGQSTLTFTITNANPTAANAITFTDVFPTTPGQMVVATPVTTTNTCGGTLTNNTGGILTVGDPGIKLVGAARPANTSCTVSVKVSTNLAGTYNNTSQAISSFEGAVGLVSNTAPLTVNVLTASDVSVSGRVLSSDGRGITNASVRMTNSKGEVFTAITGRQGTFVFDNVPTGDSYIVSVASRRFAFEPRVITLIDNVTDLDFIAQSGR